MRHAGSGWRSMDGPISHAGFPRCRGKQIGEKNPGQGFFFCPLHRHKMTSKINTMARSFQRSPLALAILVLLAEEPMHPYRMQRLIKERGKDLVINVQRRASLYQTIRQLLRAGLIRVRETSRIGRASCRERVESSVG